MKFAPLSTMCSPVRELIQPGEWHELRYLGMESIESGTGTLAEGALSKTPEIPRAVTFRFAPGNVLYGKLRPYLNKVYVPDFEGKCSTELIPLRPNAEADARYLAYFLRTPSTVAQIVARTSGARMPRADLPSLLDLTVPIRNKDEQERVVDRLSRAEGILRLRHEAQRKAAELIPALFLDRFGDPASNPKGWPVHEIGALIRSGPQNGLYKHKSAYGSGTPILRIDGFYDGTIRDATKLRRLRLDTAEIDTYELKTEDIVINRVNSPECLGKSALIPQLSEPTVFESNMMRFAVDQDRLLPGYLIALLQTQAIRAQILSSAKHAINQSSINQQDVKALRVPLPPVAAQRAFVDLAASATSILRMQELALAKAQSAFDALLHRSFAT